MGEASAMDAATIQVAMAAGEMSWNEPREDLSVTDLGERRPDPDPFVDFTSTQSCSVMYS